MKVDPTPEHAWLEQMVGEWTYESECSMGPGQPPMTHTGTETVTPLGKVWVQCEGRFGSPEAGLMRTMMTLGYDPARKRFVGTFIGTMMTHQWVYDGELDAGAKVLTLDTEGPSFVKQGETSKYKDSIEIVGPDERVLRSSFPGDDGQWHHFMTARYRRVK